MVPPPSFLDVHPETRLSKRLYPALISTMDCEGQDIFSEKMCKVRFRMPDTIKLSAYCYSRVNSNRRRPGRQFVIQPKDPIDKPSYVLA
jgi:hypothetical protein